MVKYKNKIMIRGLFSFNGCQEHQKKVDQILSQYKINYVVETGTFYGYTTAFFAERVKKVYTIELTPERWTQHPWGGSIFGSAVELLTGYENIDMYEGNSPDVLPSILKEIPSDEPVLFYLDAHGYQYWPLLDELDIVADIIGSRSLIIIDDIKVPGKAYGYDTYNGVECSLELIDSKLKKIYKNYTYEYFNGPLEFILVLNESDLNEKEKIIYNLTKGSINGKTGRILIHENII
jgi:hypothetical protein